MKAVTEWLLAAGPSRGLSSLVVYIVSDTHIQFCQEGEDRHGNTHTQDDEGSLHVAQVDGRWCHMSVMLHTYTGTLFHCRLYSRVEEPPSHLSLPVQQQAGVQQTMDQVVEALQVRGTWSKYSNCWVWGKSYLKRKLSNKKKYIEE